MKKKATPEYHQIYLARRNTMAATWPEVFGDREKPLPLKIGILADILACPKRPSDVSDAEIKAFITLWTCRHEYHCAILANTSRFSLAGKAVQEISHDARLHAKAKISRHLYKEMNTSQSGICHDMIISLKADPLLHDNLRLLLKQPPKFYAHGRMHHRVKSVWPWRDNELTDFFPPLIARRIIEIRGSMQ